MGATRFANADLQRLDASARTRAWLNPETPQQRPVSALALLTCKLTVAADALDPTSVPQLVAAAAQTMDLDAPLIAAQVRLAESLNSMSDKYFLLLSNPAGGVRLQQLGQMSSLQFRLCVESCGHQDGTSALSCGRQP